MQMKRNIYFGRMEEWKNGRMEEWKNGRTDKHSGWVLLSEIRRRSGRIALATGKSPLLCARLLINNQRMV